MTWLEPKMYGSTRTHNKIISGRRQRNMIDVLIKKNKFRKINTEAYVLPFPVSSPVPVRFVSGAVPGSTPQTTNRWLHPVAPINRLVSQPYRRSTDRGVHTPTAADRHTSARVVTQLQTAVS